MTKEEKLARKQQRKAEKVGLGKLILWNSSSCSVALSALMLGYATFYCTDVLQLAPALVGTLFMVSKIFDSFTDIVAGFIVDRTQTRWGKGRPYEIFMLFLWLSTWLLFSCPTSFATAAKCIWIFCMYTFMNSICVTFLNANNVVYMVRAFENKEQQSKIVGYGSIFTMAGAMVFNVLFPTAMAKVGTDAVGWSRLVGMIAIPLTAIGMLRILTIPEKFTPVSEKNGEQTHLKDLLPLLKESRPVLIICMVRFVQNIATGLGVATYYWQYIIGNLGMMGMASVTTILVLPLIRHGKHYLLTSGTTGYFPNPSEAAMADTWHGPYTVQGDPHIGDKTKTSFHSQISSVFKVPNKKDLYIACADRWMPNAPDYDYTHYGPLYDRLFDPDAEKTPADWALLANLPQEDTRNADYVWLPILFDGDTVKIEWRDSWKLEDYE